MADATPKGLEFPCKGCGVLLNPFSLQPGDDLECMECGESQKVPLRNRQQSVDRSRMDEDMEERKVSPRQNRPKSVVQRRDAPSRYPNLLAMGSVYRTLGLVLGVIGSFAGLLAMSTGGPGSLASGLVTLLISLISAAALFGAAEVVGWMVDVEDHLRALRGRP